MKFLLLLLAVSCASSQPKTYYNCRQEPWFITDGKIIYETVCEEIRVDKVKRSRHSKMGNR